MKEYIKIFSRYPIDEYLLKINVKNRDLTPMTMRDLTPMTMTIRGLLATLYVNVSEN